MTFSRLLLKLALPFMTLCLLALGVSVTYGQNLTSWSLTYASRHHAVHSWIVWRVDVERGVGYSVVRNVNSPIALSFSPDGRYVVQMTNLGGATVLDTFTGNTDSIDASMQPSWSPDSEYMVYIGSGGILTARVDEEGAVGDINRVTGSIDNMFSPQWSSNGRYLTILERKTDVVIAYVMDVYRGNVLYALNDGLGSIGTVSWSPDGTQLIFSTLQNGAVDIYHITIAESADLSILAPLHLTTISGFGGIVAWSPDSTQFVLLPQLAGFDQITDIYVIDVQTAMIEQVGIAPDAVFAVSWSPDGRYLAFTTSSVAVSNRSGNQLFIFDLTTPNSTPYQVFASFIGNLVWSPDGTQLTVVSSVDDGLYLVNADGSGSERISDDGYDTWLFQ